jgi:AcrR family transcriptional regulator
MPRSQAVPTLAPSGLRTPQQARSRRTRERILEAAVACFERGGYDETTTAAIAARAGVGVGTLYAWFPDKRALLLEILGGTVEAISEHVVQSLVPERWREGDPRAHIRAVIEAVFGAREFSPGIQRILWERFFKDPEFRAAVQRIEHRVLAAIETLLASLAADGRIRALDPHAAAFVIHTSVEWTASRLVLGDGGMPTELAVDTMTDMVARFLFDAPRGV